MVNCHLLVKSTSIMPPRDSKMKAPAKKKGKPAARSVPVTVEERPPDGAQKKQQQETQGTSEESSQPEQCPSPEKKEKFLNFTDEQEEELVEWLKNHEIFYNKALKTYKDTKMKQRLWSDKAKEMGLDVEDLQTWYESMRTRFGRISKRKSGDGAKELTDRDSWILEAFSFLRKHIVRVASRQGVSIKRKLALTQPQGSSCDDPVDKSDLDEEEDEEEEGTLKDAGSQTPSKKARPQKIKEPTKEALPKEGEMIEKLKQRAESSKKLQSKIEELVHAADAATSTRTTWGQWMTSMMPSIHDSLWDQFLRQSFDNVMWYVQQSTNPRQQTLQQQRQQQPQQQFQAQPAPQQFQQSQQYPPIQQFQQQQTPQEFPQLHSLQPLQPQQPQRLQSIQQQPLSQQHDTAVPGPSRIDQPIQSTPRTVGANFSDILRGVSFNTSGWGGMDNVPERDSDSDDV